MAPSHCAFSNGFEFLEKFGVLEKNNNNNFDFF